MVNTGKPSTGCATCKKRKIKCDERRPFCVRCEKIGKECPGVPAPLDYVFRPGKGVTPKGAPARSLSAKSKRSGSERERAGSLDSNNESLPDALMTPTMYQPNLPLENQGVAVFFRDYVTAPHITILGGFMSCLPSVYNSVNESSPLRYAVAANAISTLRSYLNQPSLWNAALWYYGQALEAMREAMGNDLRVQDDDVLMTVMLLKLFENQVSSTRSLVGYEYHTTAAAALLVKRGHMQFADTDSLRLFRAIRWHILLASLQTSRFPNTLYSGFDWFADRDVPDDHADSSRLAAAIFGVPLVRCQAAALLSQPDHLRVKSEVRELLHRTLEIDAELSTWHSGLGAAWQPDLQNSPLVDAWQGDFAHFSSALVAMNLNVYHLCRILVNGIAIRLAACLADDDDNIELSLAAQASSETLQRMANGVCASVPWHLSHWPNSSSVAFEPSSNIGMTGANLLVWPLFIVMNVDVVPLDQRQWCCAKLQEIGSDFGFKQATSLAESFQF